MTHLTTAEAAARLGLQRASFRRAMSRARAEGADLRAPRDQWPDQRTPLWDATRLDQWAEHRPRAGKKER